MLRKSNRLNTVIRKFTYFLSAIIVAAAGIELGLRLLRPDYRLRYSTSNFSARYHHITPPFRKLLTEITLNSSLSEGKKSMIFIGDSFVEGFRVNKNERFTEFIQKSLDKTNVINLGLGSFSTIIYERLYRDIVLKINPDVVIICLDQTDMVDDYLYEKELSDKSGSCFDLPFEDTVIRNFKRHKISYWLFKNSRFYLALNSISTKIFNVSLIPKDVAVSKRNEEKLELYVETCKSPQRYAAFFDISEKYIRSIIEMKPAGQRLIFVTYPRAEHIAGQPNSTTIGNAIKDSEESVPYFEYWIGAKKLQQRFPQAEFYHTAKWFREESRRGRILYFHINDFHWNQEGHILFSEILLEYILPGHNYIRHL